MWFSKPKSYLGIDLGAGGVKMVELRKEKGRPVLFTYGLTGGIQNIHALVAPKSNVATAEDNHSNSLLHAAKAVVGAISPADIESYAAVIRAVCDKAKTVSRTVVASVPASAVFHALVTLPTVSKEESDRMVKSEVKKLLPYPLEEMQIESQVVASNSDNKTQQVLVNAVPLALVVFYTQVFKLAGLEFDSLETESMALARSLIGRDTAPTMLVDIGAERTNFFIIENTIPVTHHSIEVGGKRINAILERSLGLETRFVEQAKKDLFESLLNNFNANHGVSREVFSSLFNSVMDPIIKEIDYSLELYIRQSVHSNRYPEKIILTGGAALLPFFTRYISEKFKVKCYIGDPWGRVIYQDSLKPLLRSFAPRVAVAIGLALRNMV